MEFFPLFAIAVGLAMDAFAVSIAVGVALGCTLTVGHAFRLALSFGAFQCFMTIAGWFAGQSIQKVIASFDHWIALVLLLFIGGKMIYEALRNHTSEVLECDPTVGVNVVFLSVSTSIDALAVGITLGVIRSDIWVPSLVIGLVAAAFTTIGITLGRWIGLLFSRRIEIVGGVILIGIGLKIVIDHLTHGI